MPVDVPVYIWIATIIGIVGLVAFDFLAHIRTPHEPTIREAAIWTSIYLSMAVVFGIGVGLIWTRSHAIEFFAGFLTEYSLSIDNLFIFLIIMSSFAVPRAFQQKVLMIGIVIALVLRGIFIALGSAVISNFSWIFYIFGAFLVFTAWRLMGSGDHDDEEYEENLFIRLVRRIVPTTSTYVSDRMVTRIDGRRMITPMAIVMLAIGSTDLLFAFDSIPALFGLTNEPYIVFTANAFALLGLRQLYFLLGGMLERLVYLSQGLAIILAFIGVKLVIHALHENELSFIKGGHHVLAIPEISTEVSLSVIVLTLAITAWLSMRKSGDPDSHTARPEST